jgi:O-antigen ligase
MTSPSSAPGPDRPLFPNARRVRREDPAADSFRRAASRLIEHLVLMYAVLVLCGIATFGQPEDLTGSASSNALNTYSNALFLGLFGLLTVINFRKTADFLPSSHVLIAFLALAAFSIMWSVDPALTIRRVGSLGTTLLISVYLTWRFDFAKALSIVGHGLLLVVVLSILTVIFLPSIGITQYANNNDELVGTWKGVTSAKNSLGWVCIAGLQIYAWRFMVEPGKRLRHGVALALFLFVAAETRSATALIGIVLSIFILGMLSLRRWQSPKRIALEWVVLGSVGLAVFAISLAPGDVLGLLGKNTDLTGRVPLWTTLVDSIRQRPLLGYGYGAFWQNGNPEMMRVWSLNPWQPPNAHNGYFDVMLDLGVAGLVLAITLLLGSAKRALFWCKQPDASWAIYVGCMVIVFIVTCLDETVFLRGGDLFCLLVSFCYFTLIRAKQRRLATAEPAGEPGRPALPRPASQPFRL